MKKLKEYKYIMLIGLVILGFVFYWFQIRPAQARRTCIKAFPESFRVPSNNTTGPQTVWEWQGSRDKAGYEKCLREYGIKD